MEVKIQHCIRIISTKDVVSTLPNDVEEVHRLLNKYPLEDIDQDRMEDINKDLKNTSFFNQESESYTSSYDYIAPITWEMLRYEYSLYQLFQADPYNAIYLKYTGIKQEWFELYNPYNYQFYFSNIEYDFELKKSLPENKIETLSDYFAFYEQEYHQSFLFHLPFGSYTMMEWYEKILKPISLCHYFHIEDDHIVSLHFVSDQVEMALCKYLTIVYDCMIEYQCACAQEGSSTTVYYYQGDTLLFKDEQQLTKDHYLLGGDDE